VAIDSTRIAANASRDRIDTEQALRNARARIRQEIRRWQKQCDAEDPNEGAGHEVSQEALARLEQQGEDIPARLERLQKSGLQKISRTDPDSRFLRERGGFTLGYTGTLAVSEDHLIVGQCVTQATNDNGLLLPLLEQVEKRCAERAQRVSADSGFFSVGTLQAFEEHNIDGYVPDSNLARYLNRGGVLRTRASDPAHRRMRQKLPWLPPRTTSPACREPVRRRVTRVSLQASLQNFGFRGSCGNLPYKIKGSGSRNTDSLAPEVRSPPSNALPLRLRAPCDARGSSQSALARLAANCDLADRPTQVHETTPRLPR
jgi:hypothetical protein